MSTETTASEHIISWPTFRVVFVGSLRVIIGLFYMSVTFVMVPFLIMSFPSPWRIISTFIWPFCHSFCHAGWLVLIPPHVPPYYPALLALMISLLVWVWSVALITETIGLNGPVAVVTGVIGYVLILDTCFRGVFIMIGVDRYLFRWSILRGVWEVVHPVARILSARSFVWASLLGSATEENAQELEVGVLGVEACTSPPPYSYKYSPLP